MEIPTDLYILYGFLAFMSLMLVTITVAVIRMNFVVGRMSGQTTSLTERMGRLEDKVDDLAKTLSAHEEGNQRQFASLNERIVEVRTLIFGINERISMLMRHRHDGVGRVYIVPEEAPAD